MKYSTIHSKTLLFVLASTCVLFVASLCVFHYSYAQEEEVVPVTTTAEEENPLAMPTGDSGLGTERRARAMEGLQAGRTQVRGSMDAFMERINSDGPPKAMLAPQAQAQVKQRISTMSARMNSLMDTMLTVANNAEATASRIEQENSVNMNAVRTLVQEINEQATIVRSDIADFSNLANSMVASDDPRALRASVEESARIVREELTIMREALLEAHAIIMRNATRQSLP
jgi:hypothetical protein